MLKFKYLKILFMITIIFLALLFSVIFKGKEDLKAAETDINKINISAKVLDESEFNSMFKNLNLLKNKEIRDNYKAIAINIVNKSDKDYVLGKNGVDLDLVQPQTICKKMHIPSILSPVLSLATAGLSSSSLIFGFGFALIPSVALGATSGATTNLIDINRANNKLSSNVHNKTHDLIHCYVIPAYDTFSKIFFVRRKSVKKCFDVKIFDEETRENMLFNVKLA